MDKVRIYKASGPTDVYAVRDWLLRNGIAVHLRGESLLGLGGLIPMLDSWPSLWVAAEDEERAREALALFEGPALVHPAWECPHCGETNEPTFGSCWSCGKDSPALAG